jgi:hypothetical protein
MDLRALIFVPALVGAAIFTAIFLTFVAHYYLTVLESTAAGARQVVWGGGSVTDAFWKPFYLAWLLCLWLGPAYVIGRALAGNLQQPWVAFAVPVLVAWLLYPVSQLSSLCASSVWMPLHPQVFARLAQRPAATAGFFALTLPVFAVGGMAFRWSFRTVGEWQLLFVGMPLLAVTLLLYARLLGRLAFALTFTKDILKRKKTKKPKPPADSEAAEPKSQPIERSYAAPPLATPDGELEGYNVLAADDPPVARKRVVAEVANEDEPAAHPTAKPRAPGRTWTDDDDDATPYVLNAESPAAPPLPEAVARPTAEEMELQSRRAPKRPKRVWGDGLLAFFAQPETVMAILILCAAGVVAGAMVRVARQFDPTAGG